MRNHALSPLWQPYTRVFFANDGAEWVLTEEMREHARTARRLGLAVGSDEHALGVRRQCVFYANQFVVQQQRYLGGRNRFALWYVHGISRTKDPALAACYDAYRAVHHRIQRVQVSNRAMRDLVLDAGTVPDKVFLIHIGIRLELFPPRTPEASRRERARLGIPQTAVVLGSFQKDGVGWGKGVEPKWIKGPDTLVSLCRTLHERIPELFVLLSGPARGFVRAGLEAAQVPYVHVYPARYADVGRLFQAIDAYAVTSREEGGPKAVLEAMASSVPLVTTRVGQAADLVRHGENAWMTEVDDHEALAYWTEHALRAGSALAPVIAAARTTAAANSYQQQEHLWRAFHNGFVNRP